MNIKNLNLIEMAAILGVNPKSLAKELELNKVTGELAKIQIKMDWYIDFEDDEWYFTSAGIEDESLIKDNDSNLVGTIKDLLK